MGLRVTAAAGQHDLLFLPWDVPLEEWPESTLVALPRGISRHIVRFVRLGSDVYAVKETVEPIAQHEYDLLFELGRRGIPCVDPVGIVAGRTDQAGEDLPAAIITRHLQFSLPYRALFSTTLRPDTANRLLDALAVLMVRLHLVGFAWGDCSLSNTLFRRDAGAFAANYEKIFGAIRGAGVDAPIYTTLATKCMPDDYPWKPDNAIATAERALPARVPGVTVGVDRDALIKTLDRRDDCHLGGTGAAKMAQAWFERFLADSRR